MTYNTEALYLINKLFLLLLLFNILLIALFF